ncbi:hypothetical protein GQ55_2G463100 [Panicum hallii var. hallii]|uniref:Uncharacterized protein n=1 Tax=Panicum hallii var. hallii TaxID=1504633 RepID=A0A2T7EZQ2_9POAL|nr:hypothetical protein GQ55_2G463100 [Panicum hallii var. hallii]
MHEGPNVLFFSPQSAHFSAVTCSFSEVLHCHTLQIQKMRKSPATQSSGRGGAGERAAEDHNARRPELESPSRWAESCAIKFLEDDARLWEPAAQDSLPIAKRIAPLSATKPGSTRTSRPNSCCSGSCFLGGKWSWPWMLQPATGGTQDTNRSLCFAGFPSYPILTGGDCVNGQADIFLVIRNGKVVGMIELDFLEQGTQNIVTWK